MKKYNDGSSLCRGIFAVTVFGKNHGDALDTVKTCFDAAKTVSGIFPPEILGASGNYINGSEYAYTLRIGCLYIQTEG